jgi:S-adenosylmethionine decarboxylase
MSECNEKIDSVDAIEQFFGDIITELKMKPLSEIMIKEVDSGEEGRGISAVQMITTSSITFHSDDDERSVYLDIFSCKEFDPKQALEFACKTFEPKEHAAQLIYRDAGPRK